MLYVSFSLAQSVSRLKSVFRSVYCNLAHRRVESPEHPYKRRRRGWSKLTALASKICGHGRCRPGLALISSLCGQYIKTGIPQPGAIESTLRHIHIHTSSCERTHSHTHAHTKTQRTAKHGDVLESLTQLTLTLVQDLQPHKMFISLSMQKKILLLCAT